MFTMAEFLSNEDNNYHTENGVEMAREFGTEEELKLMLQIQSDHYARGHILPDEIEARMGIVKKYWPHLEKVGSVVDEAPVGKTTGYAPPTKHTISNRTNLDAKERGDGSQVQTYRSYSKNYQHDGAHTDRGLSTMSDVSIDKWDPNGKMTSKTYNRFIMPGGAGVATGPDGVEKKIQMKGPQSWAYDRPKPKLNASTQEAGALETSDDFRAADEANMQHAKEILEKLIREMDLDIRWRSENSREFFNNGDRAGVGSLMDMKSKLEDIRDKWDDNSKLYGM